jgi:fatty acid desaturase
MTLLSSGTDRRVSSIEWPTLGLILLTYVILGSLVWFHASLPWWVILPIGAYFAALHGSLQHEVLHGHPTRSRTINEMLVFVTVNFWLPYRRYRDIHLQHHNDYHLTDPELDPESFYMLPENWARLPGIKRWLYTANNTLGVRMLLGPAISVFQVWVPDIKAILKGDRKIAKAWALFALSSCISVWFIVFVCGMPFWQYVLLIAYPGVSLSLVRSFCEHQAAEDIGGRTIIVEASPFWSLLFLNNNLHVAHHSRPSLAWYKLPQLYRQKKEEMLAQNHHYTMMGYGEIFRRYFFKAKEPIAYPNPEWLDVKTIP